MVFLSREPVPSHILYGLDVENRLPDSFFCAVIGIRHLCCFVAVSASWARLSINNLLFKLDFRRSLESVYVPPRQEPSGQERVRARAPSRTLSRLTSLRILLHCCGATFLVALVLLVSWSKINPFYFGPYQDTSRISRGSHLSLPLQLTLPFLTQ